MQWEAKVNRSQEEFDNISKAIKKELDIFELQRVKVRIVFFNYFFIQILIFFFNFQFFFFQILIFDDNLLGLQSSLHFLFRSTNKIPGQG